MPQLRLQLQLQLPLLLTTLTLLLLSPFTLRWGRRHLGQMVSHVCRATMRFRDSKTWALYRLRPFALLQPRAFCSNTGFSDILREPSAAALSAQHQSTLLAIRHGWTLHILVNQQLLCRILRQTWRSPHL